MLDDVSVNPEWHAAYLHGQVLDTSHRPVGSSVSPFHLDDASGVQGDSEGLDEVLSDDDYLQAGVVDGGNLDITVDQDVEFLQWETKGKRSPWGEHLQVSLGASAICP